MNATDRVTVTPMASGETHLVSLDGIPLGSIADCAPRTLAWIHNKASVLRFATRDAAIAALVSNHLRGYWTGEL